MKPDGNPYEVGYSGDDLTTRTGNCECCQFVFEYRTPRKQPRNHARCEDCTTHNLLGTDEEHIDALYSHLDKHRAENLSWQEATKEAQAQRDHAEERRRRAQNAIDKFKSDRDGAVRRLEEIAEEHHQRGKHCKCGKEWPCRIGELANPFWL